MKASLLGFACMLGIGFASEPVEFPMELGSLKTKLRTYEGAKIVNVDAIGVKVVHESGTARVPFHLLPEDIASKFERDAAAAKLQAAAEVAEENIYHQQVAAAEMVALREKQIELERNGGQPKKSQADLMQASIRAENLQNYITGLRMGILKTEAEIAKKVMRAQQAQIRANARDLRDTGTTYGSRSLRGATRMISARIQNLPNQVKIEQAKILIERAEIQIMRLERGD